MLRERYMNPMTSFGFSRLFCTESNQDLLIDFLNTILPFEHRVRRLTYRTREVDGTVIIDCQPVLHVDCETDRGEKIVVEMQRAKHNFFGTRRAYYDSFPLHQPTIEHGSRNQLSAMYTLGVLGFVFCEHKDDPAIMHVVNLEAPLGQGLQGKVQSIYLQLPKFTKTIAQIDQPFEQWLFLLNHLYDFDEPPAALQTGIFRRVFEVADIQQFSPSERQSYADSVKHYRDLQNVIDTARAEGYKSAFHAGPK
ncbi:MAG: hypothetical protein HC805_07095 [Alkalinema sp. RL_2_19]|nr:hypothetical protein [Alkalinema sp. RL_2_19]